MANSTVISEIQNLECPVHQNIILLCNHDGS